MGEQRKKRGWRFWTAVAAAMLFVAYPLSLGPWQWLNESGYLTVEMSRVTFPLYKPIYFLRDRCPDSLKSAFDWYLDFWKGIASDPIRELGLVAGTCVIVLIVRIANRRGH